VLHIHRAERADRLVDALAALLGEPLDDPFATEVVAVPSRGVERWLSQRLAAVLGARAGRADGVCANLDLPFPSGVVGTVLAAATGIERATDPWAPARCVWPLLDVVEANRGASWLGALGTHLHGPHRGGAHDGDAHDGDAATASASAGGRRLAVVRQLAARYDRYGLHRPAMLRAWVEGDDTTGDGAPLPPDVRWQAPLWRALREHLAVSSPAERLEDACARVAADRDLVALPPRLALFGITRLPASHRAVLRALAARRDVHLFALHPSPALWSDIGASGAARRPVRRSEDLTVGTPTNPLLATWGRDARELQLVLGEGEGAQEDHHHALAATPRTLLARLQDDVRRDRAPAGAPHPDAPDRRSVLAAEDRSLQVHACHGRARQVEVLRDAILHLLADDPTIEPRDIIVLCPDVDSYAPLVHATFGSADPLAEEVPRDAATPMGGERPDLRVRLADRGQRGTNPLLDAVAALLELAPARVTASQVLDLAGREPVRRRFELDDDDLARIGGWVRAAGIRWGFDRGHRSTWKVELEEGTWRRGLDRILLGVALSEEALPLVGGVLPLDDVAGSDIALAGRLAELLDRLQAVLASLALDQPLRAWVTALQEAVDALLATGPREAWQRAALDRLLAELLDEAGTAAVPLTPAEVRDLLAARLAGRPTRAGFRTGHLTVCTLVPMRSVPHRVVCLLGLDDGAFPRTVAPDGDDIIVRDPHVGDHDHRSEDRQLLLDALLAAEQHLIILYAGRDERTNATLPPAVPVGELLDTVDATVRHPDADRPARDAVVVHHPLQPFDPRNFAPGALHGTGPWGFEPTALAGARAVTGVRLPRPPFLEAPLPPLREDVVALEDLVAFAAHPVRAFLGQRLGIVLREGDAELPDALPLEIEPLGRWEVGRRLLEARLRGADAGACRAAELARGSLPPGQLAVPVLEEIGETVERIVASIPDPPDGDAAVQHRPVDVHLSLPDGRLLVGTLSDVRGDRTVTATYARLGPQHRLASWVRLLALTLAVPSRPFTAVTVARAGAGAGAAVATIGPLGSDAASREATALEHLLALVDLRDRGMREPLPVYPRTSAAYVAAVAGGTDVTAAVTATWESRWNAAGEHAEASSVLVGAGPTVPELVRAPPDADERGPTWGTEPSRFGRLSQRLWCGLLTHEQVVER
jgi:exodeoxyribonuclease V gamma subunit